MEIYDAPHRYTSRFLYFAYEAWFIIFEGDIRIACYHGSVLNNDSSHFKHMLRKDGVTCTQISTGGDIHIYQFDHNKLDTAENLAKNLIRIL